MACNYSVVWIEHENAHTRTGSGGSHCRYWNLGIPLLHEHAHTIQLGGLGLAVLGAIIAAGGAMMKRVSVGSTTGTGQFACAKCGAKFGSEAALNQHTKDKHGM